MLRRHASESNRPPVTSYGSHRCTLSQAATSVAEMLFSYHCP
jgi:hypothetical protein